jgi:hypothetical protein
VSVTAIDLFSIIEGKEPELVHGFSEGALKQLAGDDWLFIKSVRNGVSTFARLCRENADVQAGKAPEDWTATTRCATCGDVPIWPGAAQRVLACPWCAL